MTIHADNALWVPVAAYRGLAVSHDAGVHLARGGGHVGFHGRGNQIAWHDRLILAALNWAGVLSRT